ncbi:MAG: hypothetical protein LBU89_07800, partial [Fibromonadaceae bacterium]|nr:hypothetical protein [Fibromonadaceae bacterium]
MKKIFFKILVAIAVSIMFASCSYPEDNTSDNNGTSNNGGTSSSSGGTTAAVQSITILNNTGYSIGGVWIKPSNSTEWGSNRAGSISNEQSRVFNFSQPLVAGAYDIRLRQNSSSGNIFIKYKVALSNAVIVTFEASDLTDESNHPTINIQNRTGVSFNSIYIKPSSESDWGADYGSLSNNSDKAVTIPIPSSSYTTFDVQMRSS